MRRALPHPRLAAALWIALAGLTAPPASAQRQGVWRDGLLGNAPEGVVAPGPDDLGTADYLIRADLGEQRGRNLFHSFLRFSIGSGERASFTDQGAPDPGAIENVISRVTGRELSQIDGMLHSTIPGADVWLLNPSGVVFGAGAELDVKGSFHAATADYLGFEGGLEPFYAKDSLGPSVLATAPPTAFGFLPASDAASLAVDRSQLAVDPGETLELVGGDVRLTGATLLAPGGHVGLEAQGQVALSQSLVDVGREGDTPGTISIRGGQIEIKQGSQVRAENESPVTPIQPLKGRERKRRTTPGPGSISVDAGESLLVDGSLLSVNTSSAGNAGTIELKGGQLRFRNGPAAANLPQRTAVGASAETTGSGAAGRIGIQAHSLRVEAGAGLSARTVGAGGVPASGAGGRLDIRAEELQIENPGFLSVESWGSRGDAGRIEITAAGSVTLDAVRGILPLISADALAATGRAPVAPGDPTPARAGSIEITAGSIELVNPGFNGRSVDSNCINCSGGAGEVRIHAGHLSGQGRISASSLRNAPGNAGQVVVHAGTLELRAGGILAHSEAARGDAGRVEVHAGALTLLGGSISAAVSLSPSSAAPKAGDVEVHAGSVLLSRGEITASGPAGSVLVDAGEVVIGAGGHIAANTSGRGHAGQVTIGSGSGSLLVEGRISANTLGDAPAGSITLDVDSVTLRAGGRVNAGTSGQGRGGTIQVLDAVSLVIESGGYIDTHTTGAGRAGDITVDAGSLSIRNGALEAGSEGGGDAGTITVEADRIELRDEGGIQANSRGGGTAGTIHVHANDWIRLDDTGGEPFSLAAALNRTDFFTGVFSTTIFGGSGGSITLDSPEITVRNGAIVATSTIGGGEAGDILLRGKSIRIEDGAFVDSTSLLTSAAAGSVTLEAAESIEVVGHHSVDGAASRVASATLNSGAAGAVALRAPRIVLRGGTVSTAAVPLAEGNAGGAGGDITLEGLEGAAAREILVLDGGRVEASTLGPGAGGDILARASELIRVEGTGSSGIASGIASRTGADGSGGDVELRAPRIEVARGGEVSARSADGLGELGAVLESIRGLLKPAPDTATGDAGTVRLHEADTISLAGGTIQTDAADADGGDIRLQATRLVHLDAGVIKASVGGGPDEITTGGNISIDPVFVILQNGSQIVAEAEGQQGHGGRIQITTDNFFAFPGSEVSAEAGNPEFSGTVEIHSPDVNLAGTLTPLPSTFLDAASLMRERCAARRSGERAGSFSVRGPGGIPSEPDGWLRAPVVLPDAAATAAAAPAQPVLLAALPGPLLAPGGCP